MTMRTKTPQEGAADVQAAAQTPPERGSAGIPADVLTALALRPEGEVSSSPLDLDAMLDMEIKGWVPEPGDKLIGTVVNVEVGGESSTFGAYPLLTIRRDSDGGLTYVHAFHTVLRHELGKREVGMGDRLGIKYLGIRDAKGGGLPFEDYRVVVESQTRARVSKAFAS